MMFTSRMRYLIALAVSATLAACESPNIGDELPEISQLLGKEWVCHMVPDELKRAAIVFEKTKDGAIFFDDDFRDSTEVVSVASSIGEIEYKRKTKINGVLKALESFHILSSIPSIELDWTRDAAVTVKYDDTKKEHFGGDQVRKIFDHYKNKILNQGSEYFIIREAHSAMGVEMKISKKNVSGLKLQADINNAIAANKNISDDNDAWYRLGPKKFEKRMGICTLSYFLDMKSGIDGSRVIKIGRLFMTPKDFSVSKRQ